MNSSICFRRTVFTAASDPVLPDQICPNEKCTRGLGIVWIVWAVLRLIRDRLALFQRQYSAPFGFALCLLQFDNFTIHHPKIPSAILNHQADPLVMV